MSSYEPSPTPIPSMKHNSYLPRRLDDPPTPGPKRFDGKGGVLSPATLMCVCAKDEELVGLYEKIANFTKTNAKCGITITLDLCDWGSLKRFRVETKGIEISFISMCCQGIQAFSIRFTRFVAQIDPGTKLLFFGICGSPTEAITTLCYCNQAVNITEGKMSTDDVKRDLGAAVFKSDDIATLFPDTSGVKKGTMITTNYVRNDGVKEWDDLLKDFRRAIAIDTESSAFFEACETTAISLGVLKVVCDNCKEKSDKKMNECYDALAKCFLQYIIPKVQTINGNLLSDADIGKRALSVYNKMLKLTDRFESVKILIFNRDCHKYLHADFIDRTLKNLGLLPFKSITGTGQLMTDGESVYVFPELFDTELITLPQETFDKIISSLRSFATGHGFPTDAFVEIKNITRIVTVTAHHRDLLKLGYKPGDPVPSEEELKAIREKQAKSLQEKIREKASSRSSYDGYPQSP